MRTSVHCPSQGSFTLAARTRTHRPDADSALKAPEPHQPTAPPATPPSILRRAWDLRLWLLIAPVRAYQLVRRIPGLNARVCRFEPTCSQYMIDALRHHGLIKGFSAGVWRILRCNPYGKPGDDPAHNFQWLWEQNRRAEKRE